MTQPQTLNEDDLYRTSSQYRLWSFSPESLAALRQKTHSLAIARAQQYAGNDKTALDCLTLEECLRLVQRYLDQIRTTNDHFKWPVTVKATAVQYLARFYLSNSPITYPPKEIYKTVLFLAGKTEGTHMKLSEYGRRISTPVEEIMAPEYKIMQALRFTLDIRQPYRGLKGVLMELLNLAEGKVGGVEGVVTAGAEALQEEMMSLEAPANEAATKWRLPASGSVEIKHITDRVNAAYSAARTILDGPALLTDAYFLYTPSQLLLSSLQIADPPLTTFYLRTKLPLHSDLRPKILATISACAELLGSYSPTQILSKDARAALEEKLEGCRDPSTRDLVGAHAVAKRGGDDSEAEEKARRKKAAREKLARDGEDLFGPSLGGKG
ncbi:hypothetical protein LTR56_010217 [Elasticomyces elasticus]|nr:hypothetical protein LTR22_017233 [Elasticomyces elasticus]KAK3643479.1 hypothetical protein LTR56_010217 [Elasticomyces elasticus]KAK4925313.1 hypothetical protein LTR49_007611 [Elasticomyces elasticus]KAK5761316.1 hypothetical protein LTS12_008592 [Elasticomyces elasticus]